MPSAGATAGLSAHAVALANADPLGLRLLLSSDPVSVSDYIPRQAPQVACACCLVNPAMSGSDSPFWLPAVLTLLQDRCCGAFCPCCLI
jgi:hypothetical protein